MVNLSNVILNYTSNFNCGKLFSYTNIVEQMLHGKYQKCYRITFDTWMNIFAAQKIYKYCDLGELYLEIDVDGKYEALVYSASFDEIHGLQRTLITSRSSDGKELIKIPNAKYFEALYFELFFSVKNPPKIKSIKWLTDAEPKRDNKLAIVCCTFKKERYILRNISLFEEFLKQNPNLSSKIKLLVVDNGKTLPVREDENVEIIQNINAGGAGGFTRGIMEAMEQKFDRVLLMDDDIEILPESFFRTLILTNFLKDEYKDAFINGAMLSISNRYQFFENLAVRSDFYIKGHKSQKMVDNVENILKINNISSETFSNDEFKCSSAWWFHCASIDKFKQKGLPLPLFIRGDDIEWSWRNFGEHHLSLNGICVWHEDFVWRVGRNIEHYFLPRNMFVNGILYTPNFKNIFQKWFKSRFDYLLRTYDYVSAEFFLKSMQDMIEIKASLSKDPTKIMQELKELDTTEYFDCSVADIEEARRAQNKPKARKEWIFKFTANGKFCPDFLYRKKQKVALSWYPPIHVFTLNKKIKLVNLYTKKYEIRKYYQKRIDNYKTKFEVLFDKIVKNYDELEKTAKEVAKEFSTIGFWKEYLKLN